MRVRDATVLSNPGLRFLLDSWSTFLRNCPCDSTSMLEVLIRCIDDGIHFFNRDVTLNDLNGLTCGKPMLNKESVHKNILPR